MKPTRVIISPRAQKGLERVPRYIEEKLMEWIDLVEEEGIWEARKIKSYHDEPLKGKRSGQRSIRLNRAYRGIYKEQDQTIVLELLVIEVSKHEY